MLRKFSVQNYKNFKNKITLDFSQTRDYKFKNECIRNGLLNKVLIMGQNASGKTNLGYAIFDIVYTLVEKMYNPHQINKFEFVNGDSKSPEASFYYEFQFGKKVIAYEYSKTEPFIITREKFSVDDLTVFEMDYHNNTKNIRGLEKYGASNLDLSKIDGRIPLLRYIARNTVQPDDSPISFVMDFVSRMLYFRSTHDGNTFIGYFDKSTIISQYIVDNNLVNDFEKFLNEVGKLDIRLDVVNGLQKELVQIFKNKRLLFNDVKSSGIHSLELYYFWSRCFDNVTFLYIDEFDAYYHYELAESVLKNTIDNVKAQTVFTSHNTGLVDNEIMRPDCYLIVTKDKISSLANSTTRELREGHNIEKMLRNGEFDEEKNTVHR